MRKLIVTVMVFIMMMTISPCQTFAHETEFVELFMEEQTGLPISMLRWDAIRSIALSVMPESNGVAAEVFGRIYPETGATKAVVTVQLLSSSNNVSWKTVKTWRNQSVTINSRGNFLWSEVYKTRKDGTYYKLSVTTKIYSGSTLLETTDELIMSNGKSLKY